MFRSLTRRLYRNRRRSAVCFAGFFLFGLLQTAFDADGLNIARVLFVGVGLGVIMTAAFNLLALVIHQWRFVAETAAVGSVLLATFGLLFPTALDAMPAWMHFLGIWAVFIGFGGFYFGTRLDKLTRATDVTMTSTAKTSLSPEVVFEGYFGLPDNVAARYDADQLIACEAVEGQANTYRFLERSEDGLSQIEEIHTYQLRDAPYSARFTWLLPHAKPDDPLARGLIEASLVKTKRGGTKITYAMTIATYSKRQALFNWMDDAVGRIQDLRLTALEARQNPPKDAPRAPVRGGSFQPVAPDAV